MALFTDGGISSIEDLRVYDSSVWDVASTEDIDVTAKLGLAQKQIEVELTGLLGGTDLTKVVVTEPLRQWHALQTLSLVYADAYYRQLNDRYSARRTLYQDLAGRASAAFLQIGIGVAHHPVGRPDPPALATIAGPMPACTYYVRVAWVNGAGEEGSPSDLSVANAPDSHTLVVNPGNAPAGVTGWNVYAGLTPDGTTLQNGAPLAVGSTWTEPASGLVSGRRPGSGQQPGSYLIPSRILQRG